MSLNSDYITERVCRYNALPCDASFQHDDLLYRIGNHTDVLTPEICGLIHRQQGWLTPYQRYQVLNWLVCNGFEIEGDLALLILGRKQLNQWLEISRQAYPNFKFFLVFESHSREQSGWEDGINYTCFWTPSPGAPVPDPEMDFPWKLYWESGEMFWGNFPNGTTNDFEFTLSVYPNQQSFTQKCWVCEEGDYYTTLSQDEASLMSVAQVLEHFAVPV
jgi:hypothetical protein